MPGDFLAIILLPTPKVAPHSRPLRRSVSTGGIYPP